MKYLKVVLHVSKALIRIFDHLIDIADDYACRSFRRVLLMGKYLEGGWFWLGVRIFAVLLYFFITFVSGF